MPRYSPQYRTSPIPIDRDRPDAAECLDCKTRPLGRLVEPLLDENQIPICPSCTRTLCVKCGQPGHCTSLSEDEERVNLCVRCRARERGFDEDSKNIRGLCSYPTCEVYVGPYIIKKLCGQHKQKSSAGQSNAGRVRSTFKAIPKLPKSIQDLQEMRDSLHALDAKADEARKQLDETVDAIFSQLKNRQDEEN